MTAGIVPGIEALSREPLRPGLAIGLNASNPGLRAELMPIESRHGLPELLRAAREYPSPRGRRVTYEYVLVKGVNDTLSHARQLLRVFGGAPARIELLPMNPVPGIALETPTPASVEAFARTLKGGGLAVAVRRPRGQDVLAAHGQLRAGGGGKPG
jgi:23S rRNA (adenine2503-C2)-methyltransferase